MKSWLQIGLFALLLSLANGVTVADDLPVPARLLQWRCWYDQQIHIDCLLETAPEAASLPAADLPANLPAIVKALRQDPEAFRHYFVHVPLLSQPVDVEFTAQLARASMCGSRRDCLVNYSHRPPPAREIAALLGIDLSGLDDDPALQFALLDIMAATGASR